MLPVSSSPRFFFLSSPSYPPPTDRSSRFVYEICSSKLYELYELSDKSNLCEFDTIRVLDELGLSALYRLCIESVVVSFKSRYRTCKV